VAALLTASQAHAWGAAHCGYTHVGPQGVQHYGATAACGPNGSYSGSHYSGAGAGGSYSGGSAHANYGGSSESAYHYSGTSSYGAYHSTGVGCTNAYGGAYSSGVYRAY
jgi:hypothetical protein